MRCMQCKHSFITIGDEPLKDRMVKCLKSGMWISGNIIECTHFVRDLDDGTNEYNNRMEIRKKTYGTK